MFDVKPYLNYIDMDEPIPYITRRKELVTLYPILVKDSNKFINSYDILTIDKNSMGNIDFIQSSYLQFLLQIVLYNDICSGMDKDFIHSENYWKFTNILELCFGLNKIHEEFGIKINDMGKFILNIKGSIVDYKDFNNIIQLIMYQNILGYEDETDINPDIKEEIDKYYRVVNKGIESVSLGRKCSIITAHTGIQKKDLMLMTYYSFSLLFDCVVEEIDYVVNKNFEANGAKFKKPIEHFVYKHKVNKYANAFGDKNSLEKGLKKI